MQSFHVWNLDIINNTYSSIQYSRPLGVKVQDWETQRPSSPQKKKPDILTSSLELIITSQAVCSARTCVQFPMPLSWFSVSVTDSVDGVNKVLYPIEMCSSRGLGHESCVWRHRRMWIFLWADAHSAGQESSVLWQKRNDWVPAAI